MRFSPKNALKMSNFPNDFKGAPKCISCILCLWSDLQSMISFQNKKATAWRLKETLKYRQNFMKNNVFQLSHGIKNIHQSKLYQ